MSPGQMGHITGQMGRVPGTDGTHTRGCPAKILYVYWSFSFPIDSHDLRESGDSHPGAKRVRQKESGKKVTKKVTEASEKVTEKWPKESQKRKKVIELLLPHSFCGTLRFARIGNSSDSCESAWRAIKIGVSSADRFARIDSRESRCESPVPLRVSTLGYRVSVLDYQGSVLWSVSD